jgi:hypothetical protein
MRRRRSQHLARLSMPCKTTSRHRSPPARLLSSASSLSQRTMAASCRACWMVSALSSRFVCCPLHTASFRHQQPCHMCLQHHVNPVLNAISRLQVYNNDLMDIATLLRLNSGQMANGRAAASTPVRDHILVSDMSGARMLLSVLIADHKTPNTSIASVCLIAQWCSCRLPSCGN